MINVWLQLLNIFFRIYDISKIIRGIKKMKKITIWSIAAILLGSTAFGALPDLADRSIKPGENIVLQSVQKDVATAVYTYRASFDIPAKINDWASLSLTVCGDKKRNENLFCMIILKQPGGPAVGFYPNMMVKYSIPPSTRAMTLEAVLFQKKIYFTVWPEGSKKPENPQTIMDYPFGSLSGFGLRSYALGVNVRGIRLDQEAKLSQDVIGVPLKGSDGAVRITSDGIIRNLSLNGRDIPMMQGSWWAGPSLSVQQTRGSAALRLPLKRVEGFDGLYQAKSGECLFSLRYSFQNGALVADVETRNLSETESFRPENLSLALGISTYMSHYPQWNTQHFPTFLKSEPSGFFWGYAMSPLGKIVGIFSPDPIDSWHLLYNNGGHRINGISLDLTSAEKQRLQGKTVYGLPPKAVEKKRIILADISSLEEFPKKAAAFTGASITVADRYSILPYESYTTTTYRPDGTCSTASHEKLCDASEVSAKDYGERLFQPQGKANVYRIIYRRPWSWYMDEARKWILKTPQKAGSHIEGWYGFLHSYQWACLNPDPKIDQKLDAHFANLFGMMYPNEKTMVPHPATYPDRIQNHAGAAAVYADRYRAKGDIKDLEKASKLIDYIIAHQSKDGAYRNGETSYTSVIYVAKYLADAMRSEQKLGKNDPVWQKRFERHYASVERAIDELVRSLDNIQTEGEMTFEDGMIGCSYTQIADWALRWAKPEKRQIYIDAAEKMAAKHRCLSQKVQPDGRMNGASLRFWESQYDVLYCPNMMTSPHGWSAWRLYGLFDLYRLTGKPGYLYDAMNGMGACANLLNTATTSPETPTLHWAYQMDDLLQTTPFEESIRKKGQGVFVPRTLLSGYRPMISGWFRAPANKMVFCYSVPEGGSCDNDVHEIFKCVVEKAVRTTFVIFREGKDPVVFNGSIEKKSNGAYRIIPAEKFVSEVHINTPFPVNVEVPFANKSITRKITTPGMTSIWRY